MAFRPPKKVPKFADLKGILSQSKETEGATYQTVQILIERLEQFRDVLVEGGAGGGAGGSVGLHAPTHYDGATDPVDIKQLAGYSANPAEFLRGDKVFAVPPGGAGMDLDYLGDFVAGPVYNDGDIVVAADGIAYICVVDGTTTPPDPFPPSGGLTVLNAKFWVSEAHPNLSNEFNFGGIASGYVKSIVALGISNPTTIAVIPITDGGTGASDAPNARVNLGLGTMAVQNANNVAITGGSIQGPTVINTSANIATSAALGASGNLTIGGAASILGNVNANAFIGDGFNLTNLNASNLATGTVNTARMGSGLANATTFLRGDNTWQPISSIGATVPSGLIALFDGAACPTGWTRFAPMDGRFPHGFPTAGITGGNTFHDHGGATAPTNINHNHGVNIAGVTDQHFPGTFEYDHGGSSRAITGQHAHTFTVVGVTQDADPVHNHGISNVDHTPPFLTMLFCKKD